MSPVLAKVCLHDGREVGGATVVQRHGRGEACLLRDADDCGCAVEDRAEAGRFSNVWGHRSCMCRADFMLLFVGHFLASIAGVL